MNKLRNDVSNVLWCSWQETSLPDWYHHTKAPLSDAWQKQVHWLVSAYWLPSIRALYTGKSTLYNRAWVSTRLMQAYQLQITIQEKTHMASKIDKNMKIKGWVNISLTDEDKQNISEGEVSVETMLQDFGNLVFRGFRFSLTFDDYSDALQASLVCANPEERDYGYAMSARHPDPEMVLRTLAYKFMLALNSPWEELCSNRPAPSWS